MPRYLTTMLLALVIALTVQTTRADEGPTVFAAASLRDVLEDAAAEYQHTSGQKIRLVFAASSVLARQVDAGAPAQLYISADEEWVDWLAARGAVDPDSNRTIAQNTLVVGFAEGTDPPQKLDHMLFAGRFAMGDPSHVPAGRYAVSALEKLNIWDLVQPNAVYAENVRVALEFLRRGEVTAAIVYRSDLTVAPELVKAYTFPAESHAPIRYVAVPVKNGDASAAGFLEFLSGERGQALFASYGFDPA